MREIIQEEISSLGALFTSLELKQSASGSGKRWRAWSRAGAALQSKRGEQERETEKVRAQEQQQERRGAVAPREGLTGRTGGWGQKGNMQVSAFQKAS